MVVFRHRKVLLIFAVIVLVFLLIGSGLLIFLNQNKEENRSVTENNNTATETAQVAEKNTGFSDALPDCENNANPQFSHEITDFSKVSYLTPPVTIQGNDSKTHGYIHLDFDKTDKVPVYAPVEARAYEGAFYDVNNSGPLYTFFFEVSCEVRFMLDHIAEPVKKLSKELPSTPADSSRGIQFGPIVFEAGELVGYVGFTEGSKNWDLGVYNSEEENPYRDEKYQHSDTFRYLNAVCPYEYFSDELRSKYKKLFTDSYGNLVENNTNLCTDI